MRLHGLRVAQCRSRRGSVGPGTTGAAVWTAGTALASYLALDPDGSTAIRGKRVVGAAPGSVVSWRRASASQVLLTDGNPDLLDRTRVNVKRNLDSSDRAAVKVRALTWSEQADSPLQQGFAVVLASDVLYQSAAWRPPAGYLRSRAAPAKGGDAAPRRGRPRGDAGRVERRRLPGVRRGCRLAL